MAETGTSLAEAIEWLEMPVDGLGGKTLGRVGGIHMDAEDGEPRWVVTNSARSPGAPRSQSSTVAGRDPEEVSAVPAEIPD
jgi:hypothetical protein